MLQGERAIPNPEYHQVLCYLTQAQYEQLRREHDAGPAGPIHPPLLFINSADTSDAICEDSLPLLIRDMLIVELEGDPAAETLRELEAEDIEAASLPFEVRLELMHAAAEHWMPRRFDGSHSDESWWHGPASAAREMLNRHPILRQMAPAAALIR